MVRFRQKKTRAFGLIEVLIACAILIIITGALLAINVMIMNDITFTRNRSEAFNLAQGAIESVRQIRDTNLTDGLETTNWDTFVCQTANPPLSRPAISSTDPKTFYKVRSDVFAACYGAGALTRIALVPPAGGESEIVGVTLFTTVVYFETSGVDPTVDSSPNRDVTEANAIRVVARVNWIENGKSRQVEVKELLTNWKLGL